MRWGRAGGIRGFSCRLARAMGSSEVDGCMGQVCVCVFVYVCAGRWMHGSRCVGTHNKHTTHTQHTHNAHTRHTHNTHARTHRRFVLLRVGPVDDCRGDGVRARAVEHQVVVRIGRDLFARRHRHGRDGPPGKDAVPRFGWAGSGRMRKGGQGRGADVSSQSRTLSELAIHLCLAIWTAVGKGEGKRW